MARPRLPLPKQQGHPHGTKHGGRGYRRTAAKHELARTLTRDVPHRGGEDDGHCGIGGYAVDHLADTDEPHHCPPGFQRSP